MAVLFDIPLDVLVHNVYSSLEFKELVRLESACANKAMHMQLQQSLKDWHTHTQPMSINSKVLKWMQKMHIAIEFGTFHKNVSNADVSSGPETFSAFELFIIKKKANVKPATEHR